MFLFYLLSLTHCKFRCKESDCWKTEAILLACDLKERGHNYVTSRDLTAMDGTSPNIKSNWFNLKFEINHSITKN